MTKYAEEVASAATDIAEAGAPVQIDGTMRVRDPVTNTWSDSPASANSVAVQVPGDPERFAALGLVMRNSVTLMVAASGIPFTIEPGNLVVWLNAHYIVDNVEPVAPDGTPILYTVIATRGGSGA